MADEVPTGGSEGETPSAFDPGKLRNAMKAFKKRIKLTRLDDESRLGHGPLSSGGRSGVVAISPPAQYPKEVWEELVRLGRLRHAGHGLYQLPDNF